MAIARGADQAIVEVESTDLARNTMPAIVPVSWLDFRSLPEDLGTGVDLPWSSANLSFSVSSLNAVAFRGATIINPLLLAGL